MSFDFLNALKFDSEEILFGLSQWVSAESPTWDRTAVNRFADLVMRDYARIGARIERIPGSQGLGDTLRLSFDHSNHERSGILVLGHLDTVHPVGTFGSKILHREGDRCYGPGILDMKAGNFIVLEAIRKMAIAGIETKLPLTVLLTPDEEIGSPSSQSIIEAEAQRHNHVLVPEPARPDGSVVHGRHAIFRHKVQTQGVPTHAGHGPKDGVSAIKGMAELVLQIEELKLDNASCSVGIIGGGAWSNCVCPRCDAEVLVMAKSDEDAEAVNARLKSFSASSASTEVTWSAGPKRPLWAGNSEKNEIYRKASQIAHHLGFDLGSVVAGGGSDGNFTGALGVPTLDGLGARGEMMHTLKEHILVSSLAERAKLMAGLLATLD